MFTRPLGPPVQSRNSTKSTEAIALNPSAPLPYLGRGSLRLARKEYAGSIDDLTKAVGFDGRLAPAYAYRGYALLIQGRTAEAETDFARATAIAPFMKTEIEATRDKIMRSKP